MVATHLVGVDPAPVHRVGDLVEHHEAVLAGLDERLGVRPRRRGDGLVLGEVVGVPGEALADGAPVDAEPSRHDLLLADLPLARLEELHDGDLPVAGDGADDHAEGGGRLALAVAGVDERRRCSHAPAGPGCVLGRHLAHRWHRGGPPLLATGRTTGRPPSWMIADPGAVVAGQVVLGEHLGRRCPSTTTAPVVEQHEPVGVLPGQREVVHRRDDGEVVVAPQLVDELEHLLLVADVERGRRLVEQHDRRALGQRPGDEHALALAARERRQHAVGEVERGRGGRARRARRRGRARLSTPSGRMCGVRPSST